MHGNALTRNTLALAILLIATTQCHAITVTIANPVENQGYTIDASITYNGNANWDAVKEGKRSRAGNPGKKGFLARDHP